VSCRSRSITITSGDPSLLGQRVRPSEPAVQRAPVEQDERPLAGPGGDQPVLGQYGERRADRVPADRETFGQFDLTGQLRTAPYQARADLPGQDGRDPLVLQ
jgi:hypothetical protein